MSKKKNKMLIAIAPESGESEVLPFKLETKYGHILGPGEYLIPDKFAKVVKAVERRLGLVLDSLSIDEGQGQALIYRFTFVIVPNLDLYNQMNSVRIASLLEIINKKPLLHVYFNLKTPSDGKLHGANPLNNGIYDLTFDFTHKFLPNSANDVSLFRDLDVHAYMSRDIKKFLNYLVKAKIKSRKKYKKK